MKTPCPGCKGLFESLVGPTDVYGGASPGCFHTLCEILAKEYSDPAYRIANPYTVNAYAAQHPAKSSAAAIQSVNVHLAALYLLFEKNKPPKEVSEIMDRLIHDKKYKFQWLTPPIEPAKLTVLDVIKASNPSEHSDIVKKWAYAVWQSWKEHHYTIAHLVIPYL